MLYTLFTRSVYIQILGKGSTMKKILLSVLLCALFINIHSAQAVSYKFESTAGYSNGPGIRINTLFDQISKSFPFKIRIGFGYTYVYNPGKALAARKIFINNATNGRPEKHGFTWDFGFDLMRRVNWLNLSNAYIYGGPRYILFTGNFNFVNGNEDFDITSKHWGVGVGLLTSFPINKKLALLIDGGLDYFFPSTIYGHDTSYSPDNENVNPREDFKYNDADAAINQPKFRLKALMGLRFSF